MQATGATWYEVLEISASAAFSEIEAAYKRLRKLWHPDRNPQAVDEATERFKLIQNAWEILRDPHLRAAYDDSLRIPDEPVQETARWWEAEVPRSFVTVRPSKHSPAGFPTDGHTARGPQDTRAAGLHRDDASATWRGNTGTGGLLAAKVDGMSATVAFLATALGLGALWWPYALVRHRRDPLYWVAAVVVLALAVLSGVASAFVTIYWFVSVALVLVLLVRRRQSPSPARGTS